jgi:hypothetical protein
MLGVGPFFLFTYQINVDIKDKAVECSNTPRLLTDKLL